LTPETKRLWGTRVASLVVLGALGAAAACVTPHLDVTTDLGELVPDDAGKDKAELVNGIVQSELTRTWVLDVSATETERAMEIARELASRIERHPEVCRASYGVEPDIERKVYELYFPRRLYFFDGEITPAALTERARALKEELGSPVGTMVRTIAPEDPLLVFPSILRRLQAARAGSSLALRDGQLVSDDGHAFVFLTTCHSAFDASSQGPLEAAIAAAFAGIARPRDGAKLEESAPHRFAIAAERGIEADVSRISIVSTVLTVLLLLVFFRSLRHVVLPFVPVLVAASASLVVGTLLFDRVHGIAVAFGVSLLGASVDMGLHLITYQVAEGFTPREAVRKVGLGIFLAAATTVAGLLGLAWTSFPGIREAAVFASVGITAALLATLFLIPPWLSMDPRSGRSTRAIGGRLDALYRKLERRPWIPIACVLVGFAIAGIGLPRLEWQDALTALSPLDPELLVEDQRVRARVTRDDTTVLAVAQGGDLEAALAVNDRVARAMRAGVDAGEVESFRSLASFLSSAASQRQSLAALRDPAFEERFERAFSNEDFEPAAFDPFFAALRSDVGPPLALADVEAAGLGDAVRPFILRTDRGTSVLTFMRNVRDRAALEKRIAEIDGAFFFDQKAFFDETYGAYRVRSLEMVLVGLLLVLAVVVVRYRSARLAFAAFVPAIAAVGTTLGLLGLLGMKANLMHLVAIVLVLSIGVDYAIFVVEHRGAETRPATLVSISLACITTVFSFGLLALSSNPALQSLGLFVTCGVALSLVFAPMALAAMGKSRI
jgi:predicted exporter